MAGTRSDYSLTCDNSPIFMGMCVWLDCQLSLYLFFCSCFLSILHVHCHRACLHHTCTSRFASFSLSSVCLSFFFTSSSSVTLYLCSFILVLFKRDVNSTNEIRLFEKKKNKFQHKIRNIDFINENHYTTLSRIFPSLINICIGHCLFQI